MGPGAFSVETVVQRVQALMILDDRALMHSERLIRFAQAHDSLKKNADREHCKKLLGRVMLRWRRIRGRCVRSKGTPRALG